MKRLHFQKSRVLAWFELRMMANAVSSHSHSHSSLRCVVTYSPSDDEIQIKFQLDFNIHASIKIMKALRPNESQPALTQLQPNQSESQSLHSEPEELRPKSEKSRVVLLRFGHRWWWWSSGSMNTGRWTVDGTEKWRDNNRIKEMMIEWKQRARESARAQPGSVRAGHITEQQFEAAEKKCIS